MSLEKHMYVYTVNQIYNVNKMLVALECRLGKPKYCTGHILPKLPFGFELPDTVAPYRQRKPFHHLRSQDLQHFFFSTFFLAGFSFFFFCLPLFFLAFLLLLSVPLPSVLVLL